MAQHDTPRPTRARLWASLALAGTVGGLAVSGAQAETPSFGGHGPETFGSPREKAEKVVRAAKAAQSRCPSRTWMSPI
ncbi:hypothetical protein [Limimaricola cinnabarinus]|uniref:hypothetical protein n=1 Tax=Limimaricola cinnabarinus TaxID=1125964 RepID=UPI001040146A|nr:hypothetical protein [Limimaricola cinnabarinus]